MDLLSAAPRPGSLWFSVLGPLAAEIGGAPVPLGAPKQKLVLAMLLCRANAPVSVKLLTAALWEDAPPRTARKNLQVYVTALRKLLDAVGAASRLSHQAGGYQLELSETELDLLRFQRLTQAGREAMAAGALGPAARSLRAALRLWQGPPLPGLQFAEAITAETRRLCVRYAQVYEDWAETELHLGNAADVAATIDELTEMYPLRERLRAAQMNALAALGRQTEALAVFDELRRLLASELGLRPGPALEAVYLSILSGAEYRPGRARPAQASLAAAAALLPSDLPDFTGRTEQLADLMAAADHGGQRLTVIAGGAGMGKTALAVHAAHRLGGAFPDGRLLIHMREADRTPRRRAAIFAELARLTGISGLTADDPGLAAAGWRSWLAHRRFLVILDDAPDEGSVRPLIPDEGASALIVTARHALAGLQSAHRLLVPPFSQAEALHLLGQIVGMDRLRSDPLDAERIVTATGMLPLAIRASGQRLALLRHLPLAEYAARLSDPQTALGQLTAGDLAVADRLASTWGDLLGPAQNVLSRLAALPIAPFTLDDAAAALDCGPGDALRELESLISAGVLVAPDYEVTSHAAWYELPRLMHIQARQQVRMTGSRQSAAGGDDQAVYRS